jgi:hypothetical protein
MRNRRQLRGQSDEVVWVLVQLARAAQIQLSVLAHEWAAHEQSFGGRGPGGICVKTSGRPGLAVSGFFPLTLEQVTDFCLSDPVSLESLTAPDERAVFQLSPPRRTRFADLWAWDADIEAAREVVAALGPFPSSTALVNEVRPVEQLETSRLPAGFVELSVWAHENVDRLVNVEGLTGDKIEDDLFQRAKALKLRSPRAIAKALWLMNNPNPGGGRPEKRDV